MRMPRARVALLHTIGWVFLFVAHIARADDLRQCSTVPETGRADCEQQVKAKCASIAKYWDRRHCEDEIARAANPCLTPAWLAACDEFKKGYWEFCGLNAQVPTYSHPEQLTAWTERAKGFPGFVVKAKAFITSWSACFGLAPGATCSVTTVHVGECRSAPATYQKGWVGVLDDYVQHASQAALADAQRGLDSSRYEETLLSLRAVAGAIQDGETLLEMNKVSLLTTATAPVQAMLDKLKETKDTLQTHATKNLSEARCPKASVKNAALEGALRPVIAREGWKIGLLNLQSAPVSSRVGPAERTLRESVTAFASYQTSDNKCYVVFAEFRRDKPDGADWSLWGMFPGATHELLCANLTK
jgi:hypothetical protein